MAQRGGSEVVRGHFQYYDNSRMYTYVFRCKGESVVVRCPFEPMFLVIEYELLLRRTDSCIFPWVVSVIDSAAVPWSEVVAEGCACSLAYEAGEAVEEYIGRAGGEGFTRMFKLWYWWADIRWAQQCYAVDQMDGEFIHTMVTRLENNQPLLSHQLEWAVRPDLLPTDALRQRYTFLEEVKDATKRTGRPFLQNQDLARLPERLTHPTLECVQSLLNEGVLAVDQRGNYGLGGTATATAAGPEEPIDRIVNLGCRPTAHPPRRNVVFVAAELAPKKLGTRLRLGDDATIPQIQAVARECKAERIFLVFPKFCSQKAFYETVDLSDTRTMKDKKTGEVVFALKKTGGGGYAIKQGMKTNSVMLDTIRQRFTNFQTGTVFDITRVVFPGRFHLVYFFCNENTPYRWIQWLDHRCGPNTSLCVVGKIGSIF